MASPCQRRNSDGAGWRGWHALSVLAKGVRVLQGIMPFASTLRAYHPRHPMPPRRQPTYPTSTYASADEMKEQRRDEDQTIDAVEDAAVAGERRAHVLDVEVAFDDAEREIAELSANAHQNAEREQIAPVEIGN